MWTGKIFFLNRVALLVDKKTTSFRKIKRYYELRNRLGHGGEFRYPIVIQDVFDDFDELYKILSVKS